MGLVLTVEGRENVVQEYGRYYEREDDSNVLSIGLSGVPRLWSGSRVGFYLSGMHITLI